MLPTIQIEAETQTETATATATTAIMTKLLTIPKKRKGTTMITTTATTTLTFRFTLTLTLILFITSSDFIHVTYCTRLPLEVYELTPSGLVTDLTGLKHKTLIYSTIDHLFVDNHNNNHNNNNNNNNKNNKNRNQNDKSDSNANVHIDGSNNNNNNRNERGEFRKDDDLQTIYDFKKEYSTSASAPASSASVSASATTIETETAKSIAAQITPSVATTYIGFNHYNNSRNNNNNNNNNNNSVNITQYNSNNAKDNRKSRQMLHLYNLHHYDVTASTLDGPNNAINSIDANNNDNHSNILSTSSSSSSSSSSSYKFHSNLNGDNNRNGQNAIRILYQVGNSEADLPDCAPNAVCSKIDLYDTPWLERQCRCPTIINELPFEYQVHHHHVHHHHHLHPYSNSNPNSHQFHHYRPHSHTHTILHSHQRQHHRKNTDDKIMRHFNSNSDSNNDNSSGNSNSNQNDNSNNNNSNNNNNNSNNNNNNSNNYRNYFEHINHEQQQQDINHLYLNGHIDDISIRGSVSGDSNSGNGIGSSIFNDKQLFDKLHFKKLMYKHLNAHLYENDSDNYDDRMMTMIMMKHKQNEYNSALPNSSELNSDLESNLSEYTNVAIPGYIDHIVDVRHKNVQSTLPSYYEKQMAEIEYNNLLKQQQQQQQQQQYNKHIPSNNNNIGGCPISLDTDDGHTIADKTRHYKLCQPIYKLPLCRHFRDYTWTLTTSTKMNSTEQIVHCRCPRGSVTYLTKREPLDDHGISYRYLFACSPVTRLRCQRKQPCKLFTVRKRQEFIDEVNINLLCQCPKGHHCPTHHTQAGILAGETFLDDNIQTYSGYCMAND